MVDVGNRDQTKDLGQMKSSKSGDKWRRGGDPGSLREVSEWENGFMVQTLIQGLRSFLVCYVSLVLVSFISTNDS